MFRVKVSGTMAVPISFMTGYNPGQFRIVSADSIRHEGIPAKGHGLIKDKDGTVNGQARFVRVCIVRRS